MKAIPTIYRGVEFKSRLEANTAAFFDQHGIAWQYEPQSFLLEPGLHYWPDFYLSDLGTWVECKGVMDELSRTRIERFAQMIITGELGRTDLSGGVAWPTFLLVASEECRFWVCLKKCPAELVHAYKIEKASRAGIGRCKHCQEFSFCPLDWVDLYAHKPKNYTWCPRCRAHAKTIHEQLLIEKLDVYRGELSHVY